MTTAAANTQPSRIPIWVWIVIAALSLIEPAQHIWLRYAPPAEAVATGLHIPDDAIFLQAMRMFESGFYSPYATCKAGSAYSPAYFALPYLWFYGTLGQVGRAVGLEDFITLGIANGLGAFAYLLVVYCFLGEIAPRYANMAFALFSLGGGLGGVAYLVSVAAGMQFWPGFEDYFRRFALYELLEGPYLSPLTCLPRIYYTLPLALGLGGLTAHIRAIRIGCSQHLGFAVLLYGAATLLNMRVGAFVAAIATCYLLSTNARWRARAKHVFAVAAPVGLVGCCVVMVMRTSPIMISNHEQSGAMAMWLSPFLSAAILILIPAAYQIGRAVPGLTRVQRFATLAALGYFVGFCGLFAIYQIYYGNVLICRDGVVSIAISDWALLGALAGVVVWMRSMRFATTPDPQGWIVVWFTAFLAASVSGLFHGWFLRFGPQRLMVLIGLPMSVLAAQGIDALRATRPRFVRFLTVFILGCGITSIVVSGGWFQGALGWGAGNEAFAWAKPGLITRADDAAMKRTPEGRVLAPPLAADVFALRSGHTVVLGTGSFNLTDQPYGPLEYGVHRFFSTSADDAFRRQFVSEWGVDYVYCSDTWRVEPAVIEQLRQSPWLRIKFASGMAVVFEVLHGPKAAAR